MLQSRLGLCWLQACKLNYQLEMVHQRCNSQMLVALALWDVRLGRPCWGQHTNMFCWPRLRASGDSGLVGWGTQPYSSAFGMHRLHKQTGSLLGHM